MSLIIWRISPGYWSFFFSLMDVVINPNKVNKQFLSRIYEIPKAVYVIFQNYE